MIVYPLSRRERTTVRWMVRAGWSAAIIAIGGCLCLTLIAGCAIRKAEQAKAGPGWQPTKIASFAMGRAFVKTEKFEASIGGTTLDIWWPFTYVFGPPLGTPINPEPEGGDVTAAGEPTVEPPPPG